MKCALVPLIFAFQAIAAADGIISTLAGTDLIYPPEGVPATQARLRRPGAVAVDAAGNLFITGAPGLFGSPDLVFRVDARDGRLRVVAGNYVRGFSGDGGPATSASLSRPSGVAVDSSGNLYIVDGLSGRIRRVSPDGTISTVAGNGKYGYSGDGGRATQAGFRWPQGIAADSAGNLYVADAFDHRIRKVSKDGIITTLAGTGTAAYSGDDGPAVRASLNYPYGVAVDSGGNVFILENGNHRIRKVTPDGIIRTFYNGTQGWYSLAVDGAGNVYTAGEVIEKVDRSGVRTVLVAANIMRNSLGVATDPSGQVYIADWGNGRILRVSSDGKTVTTVAGAAIGAAGDGGPATSALLGYPSGVAADRAGNVFIADLDNLRVRKVGPDGIITTVAGNGEQGLGGDGGPALKSPLIAVDAVAVDTAGNLFLSENYRIRKVTPDGIISTVAGTGLPGFSGDNGPAVKARLGWAKGIALNRTGELFIADYTYKRIRKVARDGVITTFAGTGEAGFAGDGGPAVSAKLNYCAKVAVDAAGNVLIADTGNGRIRKVTADGMITTFADGVGGVTGIDVDASGNVFLVPFGHGVIRISPDGNRTAVAGSGQVGFAGDGGLATEAALRETEGVAIDAAGNLYIADAGNDRIRKVSSIAASFRLSPSSLTFNAAAGGSPPPDHSVDVLGSVAGLSFTASARTASGTWLAVTPAQGAMPASLRVSVNPSGLQPGTYDGTITVTAPNAAPPALSVAVKLIVAAGQPARLNVEIQNLSFSFAQGAGPSATQLRIGNRGGGTLEFTASASVASGGEWLSVSPATGSATSAAPVSLTVTANPGSLPAGTYTGALVIASPTTDERIGIPVAAAVTRAQRVIIVSQTGLTFTAVSQGGGVLPQSVGVLNVGQGSMNWSATASVLSGPRNWLSVSPSSGLVNRAFLDVSMLDVAVDTAGLDPGEYYGRIEVATAGADNSPQTVLVLLNVLPAGANPGPEVRPTGMIFTGTRDASAGSQIARIANVSGKPVAYGSGRTFLETRNWFVHVPESATILPDEPGTVVVQTDFSGLSPGGVQRGALTLLFADGAIRTISILSVVAPSAGAAAVAGGARLAAGCTPAALLPQFTSLAAGFPAATGQPTSVRVKVVDDCSTPMTDGGVVARFSNLDPQISLVHEGGGLWSGTWQPRNGDQPQVLISVWAARVDGQRRILGSAELTGSVRSGSRTPIVAPGAVLNGASFAAGTPVAPGGLISIFGARLSDAEVSAGGVPLPRQLSGTEVTLAGRPLPLLYASDGQINAQVPYDVPFDIPQQLLVRRGATLSVPETITVAAAQPAIFAKDRSGRGQGVIINAQGELVEPPRAARAGDAIVIYCAGLGAVDPPVTSGSAAPDSPLSRTVSPVSVTIGGISAQVLFAGLTPRFSGLYQVNAVVPAGVTPGDAVPVILTVARQMSPQVTMAVR